jgi:hypothetical protein
MTTERKVHIRSRTRRTSIRQSPQSNPTQRNEVRTVTCQQASRLDLARGHQAGLASPRLTPRNHRLTQICEAEPTGQVKRQVRANLFQRKRRRSERPLRSE